MASIDRFGNPLRDDPFRGNVRVVATSNISLSGLQTIDGVTLEAGDRVLVVGQSTASQNGVYLARTGAWSRARDLSTSDDFKGPIILAVEEGTVGRNKLYSTSPSGTVTVGTTSLTFTEGYPSIILANSSVTNAKLANMAEATFKARIPGAGSGSPTDAPLSTVNVKMFGAVGDEVTDDTSAFQSALAAHDRIYVPPGTYNVKDIDIASGKTLIGAGKGLTTLRTASGGTRVVRLNGDAAEIRDLAVNGNLQSGIRGVEIAAGTDYVHVYNVHVQFCTTGFYNSGGDAWTFIDTSSDNCTYSVYNANRGINVSLHRHFSRGGDTYGIYLTYSDQQPQTWVLSHCGFFGNTYGHYFAKDVFVFNCRDSFIDDCSNTAVYGAGSVASNSCADILYDGCFLYAPSYCFDIGENFDHFTIQNCTMGSSIYSVRFRATSSQRTSGVVIRGNRIGNNSSGDIYLDSVAGAVVEDNVFTAAGSGNQVTTAATFTGYADTVLVGPNTYLRTAALSSSYITEKAGSGSNIALDLTQLKNSYTYSIRIKNSQPMRARNAANNADLDIWSLNSSDNLIWGNSTSANFFQSAIYPTGGSFDIGFASGGEWRAIYATQVRPGNGTVIWTAGSGTPEGSVTAPVGSLYTRTNGGASTTLYVKESGTGNTGWRAV